MNNEILNTAVQLATKTELEHCFNCSVEGTFVAWGHFIEKAELADKLGGQKLSPSQVMSTINDAAISYCKYMNKNSLTFVQNLQEYQTELLLIVFKEHGNVKNELQRVLITRMMAQQK